MRIRGERGRVAAALVVASLVASVLAGCAVHRSQVIDDSVVTIGLDTPFTSQNPWVDGEGSMPNLGVAAATLTGFSYVDAASERVFDASFGSIRVVAEDPLTVEYTVADGLRWSDGAPIDAVDLLLDWAARSGALDRGSVDFDAAPPSEDSAIALVSEVPVVSHDRKTLAVEFDDERADWSSLFESPLPAHLVARVALGSEHVEAAKDDVLRAVAAAADGDREDLAKIAHAWSSIFAPTDAESATRLVSSGPYVVVGFEPERFVELKSNPHYSGIRSPHFDHVVIRAFASSLTAIQAMQIGAVQAVALAGGAPLQEALDRIDATITRYEFLPSEPVGSPAPDATASPADAGGEPAAPAPEAPVIASARRVIDGIRPLQGGAGLLWNLWEWSPGATAPN